MVSYDFDRYVVKCQLSILIIQATSLITPLSGPLYVVRIDWLQIVAVLVSVAVIVGQYQYSVRLGGGCVRNTRRVQ